MRISLTIICVILVSLGVFAVRNFISAPEDSSDTLNNAHIPKIHDFTLSNGMRVILAPNHRVPAISHTLWLKVGAADDPQGKSGLAHYLEHLMFKGSAHTASGEYSKTIERLGGEHNAFTGRDFTGYYVKIAKEHLERIMQMEAERMQFLQPDKEEYDEERKVILEERASRVENNPSGLFAEQMQVTLLQHHPYRIPIIGWQHEMEALTLDDAMAFYHQYYHPANMVLVVSGDVTLEPLRILAERYYGSIDTGKKYQRAWLQEPPTRAEKYVDFLHPQINQRRWVRHYIAPSLAYDETKHALPLMLLAHLLGGSQTSILYQTLVVEKKLASNISVNYDGWSLGPGKLSLIAIPSENVEMETISQEIDRLLNNFLLSEIDQQSLLRTKTQYKAEAIFARDGLYPIAMFVGQLAMLDVSLNYFTQWEAKIEAITTQQINAAANYVLQPNASVTGVMRPAKTEGL